MKVAKVEIASVDFKLWCERCCIRIAPNEERTVSRGKAYHPNCYSKISSTTSKSKGRSAATS